MARSALTEGQTRTQLAAAVATQAIVFVRKARAEGCTNTLTRKALWEAAQTLNLDEGPDGEYSMRTVIRLVKANARLMGETHLLDL